MGLGAAILLGILQGLTEFLPVSSSGHLALAQIFIPGFSQPGLIFDVALHGGTLLSVLALEWGRIRDAFRQGYAARLAGLLLLGTGTTALLAFPLRGWAEAAFAKPVWLGLGFVLTAVVLAWSGQAKSQGGGLPSPWQAAVIGLVQGIAVFPGVSRSGATIVAGVWAGVDRRWVADFSFLLSIPAVAGALIVELFSQREALMAQSQPFWAALGLGALAAAVSGLFALVLVRRLLFVGRLSVFSWYLAPLGLTLLGGAAVGWWS